MNKIFASAIMAVAMLGVLPLAMISELLASLVVKRMKREE